MYLLSSAANVKIILNFFLFAYKSSLRVQNCSAYSLSIVSRFCAVPGTHWLVLSTHTNGHIYRCEAAGRDVQWLVDYTIKFASGSTMLWSVGRGLLRLTLRFRYCFPQLLFSFLSASLYVSKRGAYWDRLCRDVVGRWLVGWLVVGCHARALWPNGAS